MGTRRNSVVGLAKTLCDLVINDGGNSAKAFEIATKLEVIVRNGGAYEKQHDSHEARILYRHLNLYRNKLAKAKSDYDRARWQEKLTNQEAKIAEFENPLDLDGL